MFFLSQYELPSILSPPSTETPTPTGTPTPYITSTSIPTVYITQTPTQTPVPIPFEVAISLDMPMHVQINGSSVADRFVKQGLFERLEIIECLGCSNSEIDQILGKANVEEWKAVRDYRGSVNILYVHSSWHITYGPYLGEIFRRIIREEDLIGVEVCFNDICFVISDYKILERESISGSIPVSDVFPLRENQLIIVTCSTYMVPGLETPKMLIELVPR